MTIIGENNSLNSSESEGLREALIDLQRINKLSQESNLETSHLLEALKILEGPADKVNSFNKLILILKKIVNIQDAMIIVQSPDLTFHTILCTNRAFETLLFQTGSVMKRVIFGDIVSCFDVSLVKEWNSLTSFEALNTKSALHILLRKDPQPTILICTHPDKGAFGGKELNRIKLYAPLIAQLILNIEHFEQLEMNSSLRLEKEAAEQANLTKSAFLANISHELRTPMHGILSFARFGLRDCELPGMEVAHEYFQEISNSGEQLMHLLNDLLDLAKLESGKMEYKMEITSPYELCEAVIFEMSAFTTESKFNISLVSSIATNEKVMMDSARISQVLRNLLSNAIKFSTAGCPILVELSKNDTHIETKVINRGHVIPGKELEIIFDKFIQSSITRTGAGGTGLGLAICREIMTNHNGKIWCTSSSAGLTQFIFTLPLND